MDDFLINSGQSQTNSKIKDFCQEIGEINTVEDLKKVDKAMVLYFDYDPTTPKFERSVIEIFDSKTYSGCSDVGLIASAVLREKGIPTIYVETASIDWLKAERKPHDEKIQMLGHIFLEVLIGDTWYLYDPTHRCYYPDYNRANDNYPDGYYVFTKGLNPNSHGVSCVADERNLALEVLKDLDLNNYSDPNYKKISLREQNPHTLANSSQNPESHSA